MTGTCQVLGALIYDYKGAPLSFQIAGLLVIFTMTIHYIFCFVVYLDTNAQNKDIIKRRGLKEGDKYNNIDYSMNSKKSTSI